ncbi:TPA: regulatory protein GemA [Citrobacter braakii]|uniref:gp16 family protein n=1 Tax=Citrobacter sp. W7 TaxID=2998571 RepID=UPI00227D1AF7|nr:regulatory protein GemA [Citrobacter sp. W7]HCB1581568.1 regulatory protein GemA [Citrobacter braakii]HCB1813819.1 regulatory protein GemA [Citrobacter braakii]HDT6083098.1 regulatory protein GemA [Citrobacter braakii]HEE9911342.1 regulatory protein GemA [Citrobacter braakii]
MSRASLIKLIHVARRNLQLDDDTYRSVLMRVTGKQSCRDLRVGQLEDVLKVLEDKGFRRTRPRSPARRHRETDITAKVRSIWRQMHLDGFIRDGSDTSLDSFVAKMTVRTNKGKGIASLAWCRGDNLLMVLESLKQWHLREMTEALSPRDLAFQDNRGYDAINSLYSSKVRKVRT